MRSKVKWKTEWIDSIDLVNGRFPLLRILNTTTSMLFGRVMELSIKYPQSIMVVVFRIHEKGTGHRGTAIGQVVIIPCPVNPKYTNLILGIRLGLGLGLGLD